MQYVSFNLLANELELFSLVYSLFDYVKTLNRYNNKQNSPLHYFPPIQSNQLKLKKATNFTPTTENRQLCLVWTTLPGTMLAALTRNKCILDSIYKSIDVAAIFNFVINRQLIILFTMFSSKLDYRQ